MLNILKYVLLIGTALLAIWELYRGIRAFLLGIRQEHMSSISRGWRVAINGIVLAGLAIAEYLYLF